MRELKVGKHLIKIAHEDKILFKKNRITKGDIVEYYHRIASSMLGYIKSRPLTMQRFPNGIDEEGFFQKDAPDYFPQWIRRVKIKKKDDGMVHYVVCNDAATLVYLANQLTITHHVWLSRIDKLNYPDRIIFDLDPSKKGDFNKIKRAAKDLKKLLEALKLVPFLMLTGSRGVHVVVPLKRTTSFDNVRIFAHDVAKLLVSKSSKSLTVDVRKEKRSGKIFVDWLRNSFGQTGVAPYSVRAREGAPVATPIDWNEFARISRSDTYTVKNIFMRLARKKVDPWEDMLKRAQELGIARRLLDTMIERKAE